MPCGSHHVSVPQEEMAKGKAKISRSDDLATPPTRSLRSRKREAESNDSVLTDYAQTALHLKGEGRTAAEPLQECAIIVHQLYQAAEQSCLTKPDEATKEKPLLVSEVSEASNVSVEREGRQEQRESAMGFPTKKKRRMGSCGLTGGERSRILGNCEKKSSCVKEGEVKVSKGSVASDTPLRSSCHESRQTQEEPKQANPQLTDLKHAELQNAESQNAELQHAEPKHAELQHAELQHAELQHAELQHAELQHAELQHAELQNAEFQHAETKHAELQHAEPKHAELQHAELQHAELQNAEFQHAETKHAELRHAELQHAEPKHAELQHAELQYAELQHAELQHAELQNAEFQHAETKHAELQHAEPKQAELQHAELQNAELHDAEQQHAEFQHAEPKQAELQHAEFQHAELHDAEQQHAKLQQAELKQTELRRAELQHAGEDGRAQTEASISSLYRAECDPDPDSAPQPTQRKHQNEDLQEAKRGQEEFSCQHVGEDAPPQMVNNAEEGISSTDAPTKGQSCGSARPPAELPADSEETRNGGSTDGPAAAEAALSSGRDSHGACGCSDNVSDSQLNAIVFTEELMEDGDAGPPGCLEDATELLCGIISELSSVNRRVMAAHRELEILRRLRKTSRNSAY